MQTSVRWALASVASWAIACAVDERQLARPNIEYISTAGQNELGNGGDRASGGTAGLAGSAGAATGGRAGGGMSPGGNGGFSGRGGGSAGGGAGSGVGGSAGGGDTGEAGSADEERCPDLDADGVADCLQTLLENATFDEDASGWTSEDDDELEVGWQESDALGYQGSGSLMATSKQVSDQDGGKLLRVFQCQPVRGNGVYDFAVQLSLPDDGGDTRAGLQVTTFDAADCAGSVVDSANSPFLSTPGWQPVSATHLMPANVRSVEVALISIKPFRQAPVSISFDNVLMRAE